MAGAATAQRAAAEVVRLGSGRLGARVIEGVHCDTTGALSGYRPVGEVISIEFVAGDQIAYPVAQGAPTRSCRQ
jgi:hypothetical protein